ncbi:helix-turn-helix and ligand-binding sensor domain-containing protein [Abyssalbus ytuae]|uniref:LuxR family transcriptional regulator n=1 Tax=Abyssalbus ytuae TaxID=2926907 RepID=A0A9E7CTF9_9FLAO|nr:two-component regulator propeller domain-containing protein [Abyssalbus ytuae]UOB16107.1 LuxR family transcriptional regulator [Abyssalbus ytuae]
MLLTLSSLYGQELPPIEKFTPGEYGGDNQNWMISQQGNKYVYVANNRGLLEFDGAKWKVYPTPNNTIIRAVKVIDNRIYAGFYMEFGYWLKSNTGELEYYSLSGKLNKKMTKDKQIWNILSYGDWVIFQSYKEIYFYNTIDETFKIINSNRVIYKVFKIKNSIYYNVPGEGIYKIEAGQPKLIINDNKLKSKRVISIFEVGDNLLFLTRESGFYKLENNTITSWELPVNDFLKKNTLYSGIQLSDGNFMIGTISNGVINLTPEGKINYHITQKNGLSNNTVLSLFEDHAKNVWVGLDNGINCINVTSPIQVFYDYDGRIGTVYVSKVFKDYLYLGTNQGLFYKEIEGNDSFKFVEGTGGQVWCLYNYNGEDLLCGHHLGTYLIEKDKATLIDDNLGTWAFKPIPDQPARLLKGNYDGLSILQKNKKGNWEVKNKIEGFNSSTRYFEINNTNQVHISHEYKGVFKLQLDDSLTKAIKVEKDPDFSVGKNSSLVKYENNILYAYKEGIFMYDNYENSFKRDTLLSTVINKNEYTSGKLVPDKKGRLWAFSEENIIYVTNDDLNNKYKINKIPINSGLIRGILGFENISHIKDEMYLLGTAYGYITFNLSKIEYKGDYTIHLNSVTLKNIGEKPYNLNIHEEAKLENTKGALAFSYSVPEYSKYLDIKYQYQLEGHVDKWSEWTHENETKFENLSFGSYNFKARAKIGDKISQNTISYNFEIERPWYFSNLAISIYALLLLLNGFVIHKTYRKHYDKKLKNKQIESEKLIMELKNEQLNKDIENKNRELAISKMSIIKKNELLNSIKKELNKKVESSKNVDSVLKLIDQNLNNTKDWEVFVKAFNNTDKQFIDKLKTLYPDLTPSDIRLCVYLRLNLSSKEIAPLLNISVKSVETRRYRLRKKMSLPHEESLANYILNI